MTSNPSSVNALDPYVRPPPLAFDLFVADRTPVFARLSALPHIHPFSQGYSPLHLASDRNHPDLVKLLLSKGADRTLLDPDGMTALEMVTTNGEGWKEVRKMLER